MSNIDNDFNSEIALNSEIKDKRVDNAGFRDKILGKNFVEKLLQVVITLFGITFITFGLVHLAPGDPVRTMYISSGSIPSEEIIEQTREAMGLNDPFVVQYFNWLSNILQGDFGTSYSLNRPVVDAVTPRIIKSLNLAISSLVVMLIVSFPLGVISAIKENKLVDYIVRVFTFVGMSSPNFFVGTLFLYFFALKLNFLPVISKGAGIQPLILPSLTLAFAMSAKYIRQIRSIVLDELGKEYVMGAKSRGIKFSTIIIKDVIPNTLLPLITLLGLSFGSLLSGVAVVEVIFSYPGIGSLAVNAITAYDYPLIQAYVLIISVIYMSINLLVDLSYQFLDPRIKNN